MKIDFKQNLIDLGSGAPLLRDETRPGADGSPSAGKTVFSVAHACIESLMLVHPDDAKLTGEDKVKRYELAARIASADGPLDITVEEAAEIRRLVARAYGPLIVGQVWRMIEAGPSPFRARALKKEQVDGAA